jgi:hypothetical protein
MKPETQIGQVVFAVLDGTVKTATMYCGEKMTIKATRRGIPSKKDTRTEVLVTIGKPNYKEREFIKKAKKEGTTFPIKKLQLKRSR